MEKFNRKKHWENIYQTKELTEVSWYEITPATSLDFIQNSNISKSAKIIDVGGGDSFLVDHLLELGYTDVTVLDISKTAIDKAKKRLGNKAQKVKWIVADAASFETNEQYDFWHDRAAFHFLIKESDIEHYISTIKKGLSKTGTLLIGTFSKKGPTKCSGIEIKQYSEESMATRFVQFFKKIKCIEINHKTPFDTIQNFTFCTFKVTVQQP